MAVSLRWSCSASSTLMVHCIESSKIHLGIVDWPFDFNVCHRYGHLARRLFELDIIALGFRRVINHISPCFSEEHYVLSFKGGLANFRMGVMNLIGSSLVHDLPMTQLFVSSFSELEARSLASCLEY